MSSPSPSPLPLPLSVTIIGGYLGSGKTTLVNHLLRQAGGRRLAVLVNEFGTLPIDEDLIEASGDTLLSLAGGCVCCSYGDDLSTALNTVRDLDPMPEHVLLEASGVALPAAIENTLSLVRGLRCNAVVVLADTETVVERLDDIYVGDTVRQQISSADLLLLTKTDLIEPARVQAARTAIENIAIDAPVVSAARGALAAELVLDLPIAHRTAPRTAAYHAHANFCSATSTPNSVVDAEVLARALAADDAIIRAKGFVSDMSGQLMTVQVVGRRMALSDAPAEVKPGLIAIGFDEQSQLSRRLGLALIEAGR